MVPSSMRAMGCLPAIEDHVGHGGCFLAFHGCKPKKQASHDALRLPTGIRDRTETVMAGIPLSFKAGKASVRVSTHRKPIATLTPLAFQSFRDALAAARLAVFRNGNNLVCFADRGTQLRAESAHPNGRMAGSRGDNTNHRGADRLRSKHRCRKKQNGLNKS